MGGFINIQNGTGRYTYMPLNGFTTVDLGCEKGNNIHNMINRIEAPFSEEYFKLFNEIWHNKDKLQDVTDEVIENITTVYRENSPSSFTILPSITFSTNF
jgi:hypothetical protein